MKNENGGTVTYHRAEYLGDVSYPWEVWFDGGQGPIFFTAEQGEAMGLTVPSPAEREVAELVDRYGATGVGLTLLAHDDVTNVDDFLDGLLDRWMSLRDARQDPQPASDEPEQDDTASGIDFDALPIGTPGTDETGDLWWLTESGWTGNVLDPTSVLPRSWKPYTVVYQPAPLSPGECLRGLLAGPDFERMLREAKGLNPAGRSSWACLMRTVGAAARGGA